MHTHTHSLTHTCTHSLTHSLIHSLTHSLTHTLTHALTHSIVYWTTRDPLTNFGTELNFLSLHNLKPDKINIGNSKIDKLTFEPETSKLIWINRCYENNHTIEVFDLEAQTVTSVAGYANSIQGSVCVCH